MDTIARSEPRSPRQVAPIPPRYFISRLRRRQYRSRTSTPITDRRCTRTEISGRRNARRTNVTDSLITITARCSASRITAASNEALCNTTERLQRSRGASVGLYQWGRERGARRLLRHNVRRNGGAGAERSAREKERYGRGSEVTREGGGKPPPSPSKRTASIQWK